MRRWLETRATDVFAAWNMNAHDKHILHRIAPASRSFRLWDPLLWFRKHLMLPKNGLGTCSVGTPRHSMKVNDMYKDWGPSHTSFVDTLYMRACVQRAVALVLHGNVADTSRVDTLPKPSFEDLWQVTRNSVPTRAAAPAKAPPTSVLVDSAFDENGRIREPCRKSLKRSVKKMLLEWLQADTLPRCVQNAINGCRYKASLQRVIMRTINGQQQTR